MLVRLLVLSLLPGLVWASGFKVNHGLYSYELNMTSPSLILSGVNLKLTLEKNECSQKLISPVEKEIEGRLKKMRVFRKEDKKAVKVSTGETVSYLPRKSPEGRYFLEVPERLKALRLQIKLNCKK